MPHLGAADVIVAAMLGTLDALGAVALLTWRVWAFSCGCGWGSTGERGGEGDAVAFGGGVYLG